MFFNHETSPLAVLTFPGKDVLFSFLFALSSLFVCYAFLSSKVYLPLEHFLQVTGKYSYSIYLFHTTAFAVIARIGLFDKNPEALLTNIMALVVLSPIILSACSILEIIVNEFIFGKRDIKNVKIKTMEVINSFKNPF